MHCQPTGRTPVAFELDCPVSHRVDQRARVALAAGTVHLTAINGLGADQRAVMLAVGVRVDTTLRQVKGRVNGYAVELDTRERGLVAWCACLANLNGRLCYHAVGAYRAAVGTEIQEGGRSA